MSVPNLGTSIHVPCHNAILLCFFAKNADHVHDKQLHIYTEEDAAEELGQHHAM